MGVLDSFKQDAFLSSQTFQVGNNQTPNQRAAEGHYPGKRAGRHLSGDQRESCCPWEPQRRHGVFPEDDKAVQCADTTSDIFILCCFHFICNKFTQDGKGRGSSHPRAGMWHVPIPPHRLWQGLDDEEPFQAGQVDRALSGLPGAAQTLKSAPFSFVLPGLDDCSPRACLFLLN